MAAYRWEHKPAFRVLGYKAALEGAGGVHDPGYSAQKTAFFKRLIQEGQMERLRPLAESRNGFAAVAVEDGRACYYAGVCTSRSGPEHTEEALFPAGEYLVLAGSGGLSRLAFDRLEDEAFGEVLREGAEWEYAGSPVAEVLLNGNPADAEVEVWVPVRKRS
ncbi:effector binding domain-containing protein [Paenibacillus cymbidii]|uniref:effector binding domain-containing protein n=1 Tax=Paenibacillus cymbidii TaxID=1639034 RepID=UPI001081446B|nr:effector binding domain-containing protein [Paenibacillus cymbidii]